MNVKIYIMNERIKMSSEYRQARKKYVQKLEIENALLKQKVATICNVVDA